MITGMSEQERTTLAQLAIGRILRIGSRPYQEGDVEEYERCKRIIMDLRDPETDYAPNWARDRLKGAAGD